ncbi:MAG: hypothetical protein IJ849_12400 [Selenomonadaceae bacterium]|nr:hypothetical protein [Selenomonadaceae bacterium]
MVKAEWFHLLPDPAVEELNMKRTPEFSRSYPYFMTAEAFQNLDDSTVFYEYSGRAAQSDFLFNPTFMIGERLHTIFSLLEPDIEFKSLSLIDREKKEAAPVPLYYIPFLPWEDALAPGTVVQNGRAATIKLRGSALQERRILHCRLPAQDIWLASLEAAECILRRVPLGLKLQKVAVL